jgi:hypothetical protein
MNVTDRGGRVGVTSAKGKRTERFSEKSLNLENSADYSMYSTFLTVSSGSVLFSRSNLLKRKDLCFSCLRVGLIRHRRSLRSSHLSSQVCHDSHRVTLEPARPHHGVLLMSSSLFASLFHRFSSDPDLS